MGSVLTSVSWLERNILACMSVTDAPAYPRISLQKLPAPSLCLLQCGGFCHLAATAGPSIGMPVIPSSALEQVIACHGLLPAAGDQPTPIVQKAHTVVAGERSMQRRSLAQGVCKSHSRDAKNSHDWSSLLSMCAL